MPEITITIILILFLGGLAAGFVDSIAGGGGLISVPILLSVGIPPQFALGTNKLQSSFGSSMAARNYTRGGLVAVKDLATGILFTAIGAAIGTLTVQRLSQELLQTMIPILLLVIFIFVLFSKNIGADDQKPRMQSGVFFLIFGLLLGFYDGFFGPGTGSFWILAFILLLGFNSKKASAYTKWLNFTSNIIALLFFSLQGHVLVLPGLVMAGGQISGAYLGSKLVLRSGTRFIRTFLLLATAATIIRLVYTTFLQ